MGMMPDSLKSVPRYKCVTSLQKKASLIPILAQVWLNFSIALLGILILFQVNVKRGQPYSRCLAGQPSTTNVPCETGAVASDSVDGASIQNRVSLFLVCIVSSFKVTCCNLYASKLSVFDNRLGPLDL